MDPLAWPICIIECSSASITSHTLPAFRCSWNHSGALIVMAIGSFTYANVDLIYSRINNNHHTDAK